MQTMLELITKVSLWVVVVGFGSMGLMYILRGTVFVMILFMVAVLSRTAAILCFIVLGSKLAAICLLEILRRDWGIKIALPMVSTADLRYDALILVGLTVILVFFYSSVKG